MAKPSAESKKLLNELVRDSIATKAIERFIEQILEEVHDSEIEPLRAVCDHRDYMLATIITNLRHGANPESIVSWWEKEGLPSLQKYDAEMASAREAVQEGKSGE